MSAESDVLLQEFRRAIYERLTNPASASQAAPEAGIDRRATTFQRWLVTNGKGKESEQLASELVRHWVVADVTAWRGSPEDRQGFMAERMFQNVSANDSYAEILASIDPQLSFRVKLLGAQAVLAARDSARKASPSAEVPVGPQVSEGSSAQRDTRAGILLEQQAALRIAESFRSVGHVPDSEWVQLGQIADRVYVDGDRADLGSALALATAMAVADLSRPCPFPESPMQRAFDNERAYQASLSSAGLEQVIDDIALRVGAEGDPAPRYVIERRRALERYVSGLEQRTKSLRDEGSETHALRDTEDRLSVAQQRLATLSEPASEATSDAEAQRLQARSEAYPGYTTAYVEIERRAEAMRQMRNSSDAKREDDPNGARWAREDIKALAHVRNEEKGIALDAIGRSAEANRGYAATIAAEAPELVGAVAKNKHDRDAAALDAGEAMALAAIRERSQDAARAGVVVERVNGELKVTQPPRGVEGIDRDTAHRMAGEDLEDFRRIKQQDRLKDAAVVIGKNMLNTAYRAEFERLGPDAAKTVEAMSGQAGTKAAPDQPIPEASAESLNRDEADGFAGSGGQGEVAPSETPFDPEAAISKLLENVTYKAQKDGSVLYMVSERPAFVDHGQQLVMVDKANEDDDAILAAILLAKEKFGGSFELTGSEAFKRRALEVMVKHRVEVTLKDPLQDALRREIAKNATHDARPTPAESSADAASTTKHIGRPEADGESAAPRTSAPESDVAASATNPSAADLVAVRAIDWWTVQRDAIHVWAKTDAERETDLEQLGPRPTPDAIFWFDKSGNPSEPPSDAASYINRIDSVVAGFAAGDDSELRARDANSRSELRAEEETDINLKELKMASEGTNDAQEPKLILRGVRKLDNDEYDTTVLLFKGKGDYLQGYIKVGDEKHQVLAHINERKPDGETGEIKPNFLRLVEAHGSGDDTQWKEIGYGNAVNRRSDEKPVYFDEVLFSVGNELVKARVTKHVDDEMHRKLGFTEDRKARPKDENKSSEAQGTPSPKPTAPAAKEKQDAAGAEDRRKGPRKAPTRRAAA